MGINSIDKIHGCPKKFEITDLICSKYVFNCVTHFFAEINFIICCTNYNINKFIQHNCTKEYAYDYTTIYIFCLAK